MRVAQRLGEAPAQRAHHGVHPTGVRIATSLTAVASIALSTTTQRWPQLALAGGGILHTARVPVDHRLVVRLVGARHDVASAVSGF